jgi:triosephosphate isomerase (TIM)
MIFVNYKAYEEGTGKRAVALTKVLEGVAHETQVKIIPVVQAVDVKEVVSSTTLEVWTQKIDPYEQGAHTGAIVAEAILEDGAVGTFLNHSEAKFASFDDLARASDRAKSAGLKTLIFAASLEELKNICSLNPSFVAYEPPELIGSTEVSVAQAKPEVIKEAAEAASAAGIPLIVGAGVHSRDDVKKSLELGAVGVAVASDIMKSADPKKELTDLVAGFQ